jgi:hypothetical protein
MERHTLANCAYVALDKFVGADLKKVELNEYTLIAFEGSSTRYWQLSFTSTGPKSTRVDLSQAQTLIDPLPAKDS